jgi:hypothetical protein
MERFIKYLNEEFEQAPLVPLAMKWLKNKFGENNEFVHKPNLSPGSNKQFDVSIEGKTFTITGRKHKTETENPKDTIIFKIEADEDEEVKDDEEF